MSTPIGNKPLKIAFVHPDLGIGGAERLVVDAALGLQNRGHKVDIYTSHHDPKHCFEETSDGTLSVHAITPPIPRSYKGKLHILFATARQLHLVAHLLRPGAPKYDVYFVDQLSTCVPLLRGLARTRVVFYCHFPDKLLADGAYVEGQTRRGGLLKRMYRFPVDKLEEITTRNADVILANSKFTARVFETHFPTIGSTPAVVYPGINLAAYDNVVTDGSDADVAQVRSDRPTLLSLNRFEAKKNVPLAIDSFAALRKKLNSGSKLANLRLVIAGGYDPRLEDNMMTLVKLIDRAKAHSLTYNVITPKSSSTNVPPFNTTQEDPTVLFLLNFTTAQRSALLRSASTLALLYTPANEHFGIGPVEAMYCGLPVLACNSGGPTESVLDKEGERTGWLREPDTDVWADTLTEIVNLPVEERQALAERAKRRAIENFSMDAMACGIEDALQTATALGPVRRSSAIWTLFFALLWAWVARAFIGR
ncbi:glycosyltransferase family 4 protein [Phanerochaete carnosa HHB-10118-sp]|uniref:Alpha-1,3/1,6-mannosyltransferase ALG2 n=1 Tax=Phanerochaete carnosa (strain HHB-10118-sp) TaxID=650164 RepID=K5V0T0_PHACS|nr:glycosyltransferase family 4 protein [Phanerochaete carnosa HHB-10118-sp]EKM56086.1 glycosyltransferase family 4 protein [Phanerochaete carnosa HHB-10118-sp]